MHVKGIAQTRVRVPDYVSASFRELSLQLTGYDQKEDLKKIWLIRKCMAVRGIISP